MNHYVAINGFQELWRASCRDGFKHQLSRIAEKVMVLARNVKSQERLRATDFSSTK